MRIELEVLLDFFVWSFETLSRTDCGLILAGIRHLPGARERDELLARLEAQKLLERKGHGSNARFAITAAGKQRVRIEDPAIQWDRDWDGKWRVFTFDISSKKCQQRMLLWRALRARRFGLLQRSVWVWPHDVEQILKEIVNARGIPDCFCGFESDRLFLCDSSEVVKTAWDFDEIARRHRGYLEHAAITPESVKRAADLGTLAAIVRAERRSYAYAFSIDPMLPRTLWPSNYTGPAVAQRRARFQAAVRSRLREILG